MIIDMNLSSSRSDTAYNSLRQMILDGVLPGGVPVQDRQLANRLNVSRTPVREALGRLEGEGYLTRQGKWLLVTQISVREVMEIIQLRKLLEGEAVRLATPQITEATLDQLERALNALSNPTTVSSEQHRELDDQLHLSIAENANNRLLYQQLAHLRRMTRMFGMRSIPERFLPGRDEHLAIIAAMRERNAVRATQRMLDHLDNVREAIIRRLAGGLE